MQNELENKNNQNGFGHSFRWRDLVFFRKLVGINRACAVFSRCDRILPCVLLFGTLLDKKIVFLDAIASKRAVNFLM